MEGMELTEFERHFKGKKVLLTGHTGFKGSWMLCLLKHFGVETFGYALPPDENSLYKLIGGGDLCTSNLADIRDYQAFEEYLNRVKPDILFHFAAQSLVFEGYRAPKRTFDTNISGTTNVLEACRISGYPETMIMITTDKVYKIHGDKPFREGDQLGGDDPYSASKASSELVIESYRKSYFQENSNRKLLVARSGNVIGGGDFSADRIIPDVIRAIEDEGEIEIRNPDSVRPWQHVLDALTGYIQMALLSIQGKPLSPSYNFGPKSENEITVRALVYHALGVLKRTDYPVIYSAEKNLGKETKTLLLDSQLAKRELDWKQSWEGLLAIEKTMDWYSKYKSQSPLDLCMDQIQNYFSNQ
jgi:CDP-glucose 4,6-dehydratase